MTQTERVLADLKAAGRRGITAVDYLPGFPLRSRIADLRKQYPEEIKDRPDSDTPLKRYYWDGEVQQSIF